VLGYSQAGYCIARCVAGSNVLYTRAAFVANVPDRSSRNHWKESSLREDQTIFEMAQEVLARQAKALVAQTGQPFESALEAVSKTEAGRELRELANGEHRNERARDWQVGSALGRAEERYHSHHHLLEGYMEWLEGKEAREEYYALLEELASLRG
jgi:hypothetical protein